MIDPRRIVSAAALIFWTTASGVFAQGVDTMLAAMPTSTTKETNEAAAKLIGMGPDAVKQITDKLVAPGKGDDAKARYAINTIVFHAGGPKGKDQRAMVAKALGEALEKQSDVEVKDFLIEQLQYVVVPKSLPVVANYLTHERLCAPAVRTLVTLGTPEAAQAIADAIPSAPAGHRKDLVLGLGRISKAKGEDALMKVAASDDAELRLEALTSLANLGSADVAPMLEKELETPSILRRGKVTALQTLLARRLAESGSKEKAAEIARAIYKTRTDPGDEYAQCAALALMADILGPRAVSELLKAADSKTSEVRSAAIRQAAALQGQQVTRAIVQKARNSSGDLKAELILALGLRGDKSASDTARTALGDSDSAVRREAMWALYRLSGRSAANAVLDMLRRETTDDVRAAAKQLLLTAADDQRLAAVAQAVRRVPPATRVTLIEVLAERNAQQHKSAIMAALSDSERDVRIAALKALDKFAADDDVPKFINILTTAENSAERTAAQRTIIATLMRSKTAEDHVQKLIDSYRSATTELKPLLLETIGRSGTGNALEILVAETKSSEPEAKNAAIRALGEWPDVGAADELMRIAETESDESHKVLAIRGIVRLATESKEEKTPPRKKVNMLRKALAAAPRVDEKKLIVGALGDVKTTDALELVYPFLLDKDLQSDAAIAVVKMTKKGNRRQRVMGGGLAAAALRLAYPLVTEEEMKKQAKDLLNAANLELASQPAAVDGEGFASLFNGEDLSGWVGSLNGYVVENGTLVCKPQGGGNLYTERQYTDFVLRLEFKLEENANNGLGIRAPLDGDTAYKGMELQILDDSGSKYKDLKEWQFHGSIYGVAPSKKGHLKPAGEWNVQEVTADGSKIKVVLNGETILDTDIADAAKNGTVDGKPHPGLKRMGGHIGFLGHGSRVEFRNIRIRELLNEPPQGFSALFNGKDLQGWKGLVEDPIKRAAMNPDELKQRQEKADQEMRDHWEVVNGTLVFDGRGSHLCTTKDYGDFEMLVDWRIGPDGDSGIYLRGSPQVQIWDPAKWPEGSGGLYNNKENTSVPLQLADNPVGDWNRFKIRMVGEKVTVHLNDVLVVDNVVLENYWDRSKPIFPTEQLELQSHGTPAFFRNVFVREIKPGEDDKPEAKPEETTETQPVTEAQKEAPAEVNADSTETKTVSEDAEATSPEHKE